MYEADHVLTIKHFTLCVRYELLKARVLIVYIIPLNACPLLVDISQLLIRIMNAMGQYSFEKDRISHNTINGILLRELYKSMD